MPPQSSCSRDSTDTAVSLAVKSASSALANGSGTRPSGGGAQVAPAIPVKWINYSRYTGDDFGISAEDLMRALSDFFLQSGFESQYMHFNEFDPNALERLKEAIEQALRERRAFRSRAGRADGATTREHVGRGVPTAREADGAEAYRGRVHQYRTAGPGGAQQRAENA